MRPSDLICRSPSQTGKIPNSESHSLKTLNKFNGKSNILRNTPKKCQYHWDYE